MGRFRSLRPPREGAIPRDTGADERNDAVVSRRTVQGGGTPRVEGVPDLRARPGTTGWEPRGPNDSVTDRLSIHGGRVLAVWPVQHLRPTVGPRRHHGQSR